MHVFLHTACMSVCLFDRWPHSCAVTSPEDISPVPEVTHVGRLRSGPRLMGQVYGLVPFSKFRLLHFTGDYIRDGVFSQGLWVISWQGHLIRITEALKQTLPPTDRMLYYTSASV